MSDEDELQQEMGLGVPVVFWDVIPKRRIRKHTADVLSLRNSDEHDSVIVCRCGIAVRIGPKVRLTKAEELFMAEHAKEGYC